MSSVLQRTIERFERGHELAASEAESVLDSLITESDETTIARVLTSWHQKGIETAEIYEFARIMRARMIRVNAIQHRIVDIVGTGGSKAKTFNVSTAASFVVAGAGVAVAKHGNKAATSSSGSSDVLSELGVDPAVDPRTAERCLNEIGICFMFAPNHHRLSPTLAKVRRGLGFPTIFNCVGPLCNPASATNQLIGVWDEKLVPKIAEALSQLGTRRSWVVHGRNGLDEIAISGKTTVVEVNDGGLRSFEIDPEYFGLKRRDSNQLRSGDPAHSAEMIREALLGKPHDHAAECIVLLNAAAALLVAETVTTPLEATGLARESLVSGKAHAKLKGLAASIPV